MTDEALRFLERRARETGAVGDEAAWLRARVRAGDLDPERLWMAAVIGHEPARLALAERPTHSTREAARLLHIAETTLRGWRDRGCPCLGPRQRLRWELIAVMDWLFEQGDRASPIGYALAFLGLELTREVCQPLPGGGLEQPENPATLRARAIPRLLGMPPPPPPAPSRWRIESSGGDWVSVCGPDYEAAREIRVVDARTGAVAHTFQEFGDWMYMTSPSWSGVAKVEIAPDDSCAIATHHDGRVERVPLPS